ncbi:MAG: hypothetical protein J0H18_03110 [Rhizobiales bacterium]|nr:hypothetical protein [Hyphomicrobiales bacterium]OJY06647.1 MAG: hypothetical protein BGP07_16515 [Rhizobiales bacterium 63-22]
MSGPEFAPGDPVCKTRGYRFPGVVASAFQTLAGEWRYAVECTAPAVAGMLHIFNGEQIAIDPDDSTAQYAMTVPVMTGSPDYRAGVLAAARWHDAQVLELRRKSGRQNRGRIAMHKISAAALRSLTGETEPKPFHSNQKD